MRNAVNRSLPVRVPVRALAALTLSLAAGPSVGTSTAETPFTAALHESEEATNLARRAKQAVEQRDWKLAIDCLQRMIDLPGDALLGLPDGRYESARRYAHRAIGLLPAEGREAYRLLFDAESRVRFEQAVRDHDEAAMREIADRLLLTRYGDDAAGALAAWWLDEGRAGEAAMLLIDLLDLHPDFDLPLDDVVTRLWLALALAGDARSADETAKALAAWATTQPAVAERLRRAREAAAVLAAPPSVVGAWPALMGGGPRAGLMPFVEPTLVDQDIWRLSLEDGDDPIPSDIEALRRSRPLFPASVPVTDGRVMVVRQEGLLRSVDLETFEVRWMAGASVPPAGHVEHRRDATRQRLAQVRQAGQADPSVRFDRGLRTQRLMIDRLEGAVTLAHGLALTVERGGDSALSLYRRLAAAPDLQWTIPGSLRSTAELVAYDLRDGRRRWRCASPDPSGEGEAAVEFLSPPAPIGDRLLAPYRESSDLYAAVIDPADGRIVRRLHLCGLGPGEVNSFEPLYPCVADGVAYLPTNRGLLLALDTATWTIRWASRYEQHPRFRAAERQGALGTEIPLEVGWRDNPPVAVGGLVLLAPADADKLFALRRIDGRIEWTADRSGHLYVLGAEGRHVWVAGPSVTKLALDTGRVEWSRPIAPPTGRGAFSGNRLYLPTADGLVAVDAGSGEILDRLVPPHEHLPLGNLLCWDGSLYSCDVRELRRYPDVVRSHAAAVSAYERDRKAAGPAVRLAALELVRDQPSQALLVLDSVQLDDASSPHAGAVARLRVAALLALAGSPGMEPDRATGLLEAARRVARTPADTVRAALALAEHLDKTGRKAEAYREYVDLSLADTESKEGKGSSAAPGDVPIDAAAGVVQPARAEIERWLTGRLEEAVRRGRAAGQPFVDRMADAELPPAVAQRASLQLGVWAQEDDRLEEAEYHFRRVASGRSPAPTVAEALARLASVYLSADELHMPLSAVPHLNRLAEEYADTAVPAGAIAAGTAGTVTGSQAAAILRGRIDAGVLSRHTAACERVRLGAPGGAAYVTTFPDALPLALRQSRPEPLAEVFLLLAATWEVRAHSVDDGRLLWPATLRLLDEPVEVPDSPPTPRPVLPVGPDGRVAAGAATMPRHRAVSDGQVMILNSDRGLHAVGLATGLRLWSRRYDLPGGSDRASDAWISAEGGRLVWLDGGGTLTLARTIDADHVRWQRRGVRERWVAVRLRGDHVVAIDETITRATVFHAEDGRLLGVATFPANAKRRLSLTIFDEVLCGPSGEAEVSAFELATPGIERWRVRCERDGKPLAVTGLFKPGAGVLGIGCAAGVVRLVEPASGRVRADIDTGLSDAGVFEGAITDDVLCLYATRSATEEPFAAIGVDVPSGRRLWTRSPQRGEYWSQAGSDYPADNSLLLASANAIPLVRLVRGSPPPPPATQPTDHVRPAPSLELCVLDKRTGDPIGKPRTVALPDAESAYGIEHVLAWPRRVIVVCGTTYAAFEMEQP